jgi:hypothetical protein
VSARWEVSGWHSDAAGEPGLQTLVVRVPRSDPALLEGVVWHADSGRWRPFRGLDALPGAIAECLADPAQASPRSEAS